MSDSSQVSLYYIKESTIGQTPSAALKQLRMTGESLKDAFNTVQSNEIRDDRQISDVIRTLVTPSGGFNFELSYGTYDEILEGAMYNEWVGVGTGTTESITSAATASNLDMDVDKDAGTITLGSALVYQTDWDIVAGQFIKLETSDSDTDIDGYHLVTGVSGQVITLESGSIGGTGSKTYDDSTTLTVKGARLTNGTTEISFTVEKKYADKTKFHAFRGAHVGQMSLQVQAESVLSGTFDLVAMSSVTGDSSVGTGAPSAASTTDVMSAGFNITNVREAASAITAVRSLSFQVNNNLRNQSVVGSTSLAGVGAGRCAVTGSVVQYFSDFTLYDKLLNGTATSLDYRLFDEAGNAYIFNFPQVKYTEGEILAGGPDQDVEANMAFQALLDPTYGFTFCINRFAA